MFVDSVRGWASLPAVDGAPERRALPSWILKLIRCATRRAPLAGQEVPATHGASDNELVQFVRDRAIDGAEKNRHQALMLLYTATGRA